MRIGVLAIVALGLSGCGKAGYGDLVAEQAEQHVQLTALEAKIAQLERDNKLLHDQLATLTDTAVGNAADLDGLRKSFNATVEVINDNSVASMTRRGACGTELYYDDAGYPRQRYRECKVSDLRSGK